MKLTARLAFATALAAALAACASGPRGPSNQVIERVLTGAPGEAQPSRIVATELAFARAAKSDGQNSASVRYAGPGAVLHLNNGTVNAARVFDGAPDPAISADWASRSVVMSCDGRLAVSLGRFVDQEAKVGNYVAVWQQQSDREYRWLYIVAGLDDPQPVRRQAIEDGDIVVTAIDSIEGLVADCPHRRGEAVPPPPALSQTIDHPHGAFVSRDGTLRWRWEHRPDGTRYVAADYFYQSEWRTAIEQSLTSSPES